jgi:hypothetical protein
MNRRPWSGLVLSIVVFLTVPFSAATNRNPGDEPWPALLSSEPAPVDPGFAALQHRANASLEKLIQSASASP